MKNAISYLLLRPSDTLWWKLQYYNIFFAHISLEIKNVLKLQVSSNFINLSAPCWIFFSGAFEIDRQFLWDDLLPYVTMLIYALFLCEKRRRLFSRLLETYFYVLLFLYFFMMILRGCLRDWIFGVGVCFCMASLNYQLPTK